MLLFFFKQKTAYVMRISDWSSDVCSSDLKSGGTVVGDVKVPLGTADFSSFLVQAQSSGAKILGLANAGGDFISSVTSAKEFGVTDTMKLAGLLVFINDFHALGLDATQGLHLTSACYWDQDDDR